MQKRKRFDFFTNFAPCERKYTFKTFIWEKIIHKNKKYTQNNPLKL